MDSDIKARWVAALRSGQYMQGRRALHDFTNDTYCCLGVLCDLAVQDGVVTYDYLDVFASLPPQEVIMWAKLEDANPKFPDGNSCVSLNDLLDKSFDEIATAIEEAF